MTRYYIWLYMINDLHMISNYWYSYEWHPGPCLQRPSRWARAAPASPRLGPGGWRPPGAGPRSGTRSSQAMWRRRDAWRSCRRAGSALQVVEVWDIYIYVYMYIGYIWLIYGLCVGYVWVITNIYGSWSRDWKVESKGDGGGGVLLGGKLRMARCFGGFVGESWNISVWRSGDGLKIDKQSLGVSE